MGAIKVKPGGRYGRLVVLSYSGQRTGKAKRVRLMLCRCDCGGEKLIRASSLLNGNTRSCGCLKHERNVEHGRTFRRTHGATGTPTFRSWEAMRGRCLCVTHRQYPGYGGRGIAIDPRWQDFANFLADMGERPSLAHTIDRYPGQNGPYAPGNCRWATKKEQARNTRWNVNLEYKGRAASIAEWAEELGLNHSTLCERIRQGWPVEKALTTSKRKYRRDRS